MRGQYVIGGKEPFFDANVFANMSASVLAWLLTEGIKHDAFSIREVSRKCKVSVGLVHRVFKVLVLRGILKEKGVRTTKSFFLTKPKALLNLWTHSYSLVEKCMIKTYQSGFQSHSEMIKALENSRLGTKVILALHSAAQAHRLKNTNLNTLELYVENSYSFSKVERVLALTPQEKGYEVLLIRPYYKSLLSFNRVSSQIGPSPILLTYLDLYHFPLRGREQAEYIAERAEEMRLIDD